MTSWRLTGSRAEYKLLALTMAETRQQSVWTMIRALDMHDQTRDLIRCRAVEVLFSEEYAVWYWARSVYFFECANSEYLLVFLFGVATFAERKQSYIWLTSSYRTSRVTVSWRNSRFVIRIQAEFIQKTPFYELCDSVNLRTSPCFRIEPVWLSDSRM